VSEWIGWVGRLRRTIYSRMEELSFRTGAATVAGVIAVAATAILLTLTQGGHHAAPLREAQAGAGPSSILSAPPDVAFSPSAHPSGRRAEAAPDVHYVPRPAKSPTADPQPSPSASLPSPRHTFRATPPGMHSTPAPPGYPWPWPFPTPSWP